MFVSKDFTMGQMNALVKKLGGEDVVRGILNETMKVVVSVVGFLTFLRKEKVHPQPAVTATKQYFEAAGGKWFNQSFESQFFGLEVPATSATEFAVWKLERNSLDAPILAELGDKAEVSVSQFTNFLSRNRESQEYFIFYLRGKDGSLWAVGARWSSGFGGWSLGAYSVEFPNEWGAGGQVVSQV